MSTPLLTAIENYINGKASPAEKQLVDDWYHTFDDRKVVIHSAEMQLKEQIDAKLRARLVKTTAVESLRSAPVHQLNAPAWKTWAAVVAVLVTSAIGLYLFTSGNSSQDLLVSVPDFAPAKNTAILTLANGKQIKLTDQSQGQLATESGVSISKTKEGELLYTALQDDRSAALPVTINTIATPRGGTYLVSLPDGTRVWLNAASTLRYPTRFIGKERSVELSGEAYFEVAKIHDKRMPFFVRSERQTVEVLGTHFNVNNYDDEEQVKTTLLEGSVRIGSMNGKNALLKPGEQAIIQSGSLNVQTADLSTEMAWKNGEFIFTNNDFRTEMRKVARWYDVEIIFDESVPKDISLGGFISNSKNISAVLKLIALTGKVHFKIEGRRILVTN
ncbi:FecR family protein [Pedobacter sp. GR22-6]|uniref:FecR family protein n=1 Tax=Pedobacter sp. GR22-6 TaxID=3127957 RepID=UPI00307EDBB6